MPKEQPIRERIIAEIISANNTETAKIAINSVMSALHITQDYKNMYELSKVLKEYETKLLNLQRKHFKLQTPRNHQEVQEIRTETGLIVREMIDELSQPIITLKVVIEESKKEVEYESMKYIEEFPTEFEGVTKSNIRNYLGGTPMYKEWVRKEAIAYSNYKLFESVKEFTKAFMDSLASELRSIDLINKQDIK